jgi:transaldolase
MLDGTLKTKIFLDSGDSQETVQAIDILGRLDGQTTNPTLLSKNPEVRRRLEQGQKFRPDEIWTFYKDVVSQISRLIPNGFVSIEVYADTSSTAEDLLHQANKFQTWIPNAHIKFPVSKAGIDAAQKFISQGGRANMTLVFSQAQAAVIGAISQGCSAGQVYVSPFIGRLDDIGQDGMDLVRNCQTMFHENGSQVQVLAASVRTLLQLQECLRLEVDVVTVPLKIIQEWADQDFSLGVPGEYVSAGAKIEYKHFDFTQDLPGLDTSHDLTKQGLEKFAKDWNNLLA